MDIIENIEKSKLKTNISEFKVGDVLKVSLISKAGGKEKTYTFQGTVIKRKGGGVRETFTVRKESYGIGVERIFPLHSPIIKKLQLLKKGDVRRAKLYYLRNKKK